MKGIVSILKESLNDSDWEVVDTPYYEQGSLDEPVTAPLHFTAPQIDYQSDKPSPTDRIVIPTIDVKNNAEYFIDGVMHTAIVGYVHNAKIGTFPLLAGDVGACCGELYQKAFSIVTHKRAFLFAYPKEWTLSDEIACRLTNSFNRPDFPFIPLQYPSALSQSTSHSEQSKGRYKEASDEILEYMRKEEKKILDGIVRNTEKSYHVYVDGEFQSDDERYDSAKVISICKQLSLPSIEKRFHLKVTDVTQLEEGQVSPSYKWPNEGGSLTQNWHTWFMRLRQHSIPDRDRTMSDIIQCTIVSKNIPDENLIKEWANRLSSLAYPTCYGLDKKRWRTHIYPIYLTELYGKQKQLSIEHFNKLIYG